MANRLNHTQEQVASGELVYAGNFPGLLIILNPNNNLWGSEPMPQEATFRNNAALLEGRIADLELVYGRGSMVTGNALNHRTGEATGMPGKLGLYILRDAYDTAIEAAEAAAQSQN